MKILKKRIQTVIKYNNINIVIYKIIKIEVVIFLNHIVNSYISRLLRQIFKLKLKIFSSIKKLESGLRFD